MSEENLIKIRRAWELLLAAQVPTSHRKQNRFAMSQKQQIEQAKQILHELLKQGKSD